MVLFRVVHGASENYFVLYVLNKIPESELGCMILASSVFGSLFLFQCKMSAGFLNLGFKSL